MALYQRQILPTGETPFFQVVPSQGAGGAVPSGSAPRSSGSGSNVNQDELAGILDLIKQWQQGQGQGGIDPSGFGLASGVPLVNDSAGTPAGDVLGGLANANNGMSYEPVPTGFWGMLQDGWDTVTNFFDFGGGA